MGLEKQRKNDCWIESVCHGSFRVFSVYSLISRFIGEEVALGLRRAGYEVYGLVRSKEKAQFLMENEVYPVVGDLDDPNTYINVAKECNVYIHTAFDWKSYEVLRILV